MYTIQEISKNLLQEKLEEARKLKAAGQDPESGRIDILSLLVKSSMGENASYRMDAKMMEYQILTLSVKRSREGRGGDSVRSRADNTLLFLYSRLLIFSTKALELDMRRLPLE